MRLVKVSALCFLQCFDSWLSDRKDIQHIKNLCHLSTKVLFWNKWRKKTWGKTGWPWFTWKMVIKMLMVWWSIWSDALCQQLLLEIGWRSCSYIVDDIVIPCVQLVSSRQPLAVTATFSGIGHCDDWLLYRASYKEHLQWPGLYQEQWGSKICSDHFLIIMVMIWILQMFEVMVCPLVV